MTGGDSHGRVGHSVKQITPAETKHLVFSNKSGKTQHPHSNVDHNQFVKSLSINNWRIQNPYHHPSRILSHWWKSMFISSNTITVFWLTACLQIPPHPIFGGAISQLACYNLISLLKLMSSWIYLTSAALCPSRFTLLTSTHPAKYASACPLTQRAARLLSKVRSGSSYNPFPACSVSPFPANDSSFSSSFHWRQPRHGGDGDTSAVTPPRSAVLYLIEFCRAAKTKNRWQCVLVNRVWSEALGSEGRAKGKCISWWPFKKSVWVQISSKAHLSLMLLLKQQSDLSSG